MGRGRYWRCRKSSSARLGILLIALLFPLHNPELPLNVESIKDGELGELGELARFAGSSTFPASELTHRTTTAEQLSGQIPDEDGRTSVTGRVCFPDCPSHVEEDPYDLWKIYSYGQMVKISVGKIDALDGDSTTPEIEWCTGILGSMHCSFLGNQEKFEEEYIVPVDFSGYGFIRLSPKASYADDDVDYEISIIEQFSDPESATVSLLHGPTHKDRQVSHVREYVCLDDCHGDDNEWSEFGRDPLDTYELLLYPGEEMEITISTYPQPNRGTIKALLLYSTVDYWDEAIFDDRETLTFELSPSTATSYRIIILSMQSQSYDGMTYDLNATLWWSSTIRDPAADFDGDGWSDFDEVECGTSFLSATYEPLDTDSDGECDLSDLDDDGDGILDYEDNCKITPNQQQEDFDEDQKGDLCDSDDDNDGKPDYLDDCQFGISSGLDFDGDGCKDVEDSDDDDDGTLDENDDFPLNRWEHRDTDGDGVGDNADDFPEDPTEAADTDGDGIGDNTDAFPTDPDEWRDRNGNGVGDNLDRKERNRSLRIIIPSLIVIAAVVFQVRRNME